MSRLRESELEFARELRRAADVLDGSGPALEPEDLEDLIESLRDHAETLEHGPEPSSAPRDR